MKLKHIFENTPQQPEMTVLQVLDALKEFEIIDRTRPYAGPKNFIRIDSQGLIHIHAALYHKSTSPRLGYMPLQLESVNSLKINWLNCLKGLPRHIFGFLELLYFRGVDFTTAQEPVTMGGRFNYPPHIYLTDCPNLKTLKGIDRFKTDNGQKIKIIITNCENLAFDLHAYLDKYNFMFHYTVPPNVSLVKAIALASPDQIDFKFVKDKKLTDIVDAHFGKEADMPHLALKLSRAGYRGHAGLT